MKLVLIVAPLLFLILSAMLAPETVVICHHPNPLEDPFGQPETRTIPVSALLGHLKHGDTIGPCPGDQPTPRPTPSPTPRFVPSPTPRATPRPTPSLPTPVPTGPHMPTAPPTDA